MSGCAIGAYVNGVSNLDAFQKLIQKKLAAYLLYSHWSDPFPQAELEIVKKNQSILLLTWEPWSTHPLGTLAAIAAGHYEAYVKKFLQSAKDWGSPILLRFAHEMNGNWYPWDGEHNGQTNGPDRYIKAWHYIYNVKQALKADNIKLVWTPNNRSVPLASWNKPANYYPGDEYVDWVGMDGYNWGYSGWESFDQVFKDIYQQLAALTNKPIMIGEFASAEQGGDKAAWLTLALTSFAEKYPRIKLLCWFNIDKERDWRLESSGSSTAAFREAISDSYFSAKML